jgi:hypothetical protein
VKRIIFSEQAKADIRAILQQIAMQILIAIHRLAAFRRFVKPGLTSPPALLKTVKFPSETSLTPFMFFKRVDPANAQPPTLYVKLVRASN